MERRDFIKGLLESHLKPLLGNDFRYEKNNDQIYRLLKEYGSVANDIRNAKRLTEQFGDRQDYANHNPCTMVWALVEEMMELR